MSQKDYQISKFDFNCNVQKALHIIGEKWMLYILREFIYTNEKQSFNQLLKSLKPISSRTLSLKLKKLEERNLIKRKIISAKPIRVEYSITEKGKSLKKTLVSMGEWFIQYSK